MSRYFTRFMIETLISSKTRVKLLLKFFLNSNTTAYLRSLSSEFGESTNAIRLELNRLEDAGMLTTFLEGNKKMFQANPAHPLFKDIHRILLKTIGVDRLITEVINRLGKVEEVYLTGDLACGRESDIIDLVIIGDVDRVYLVQLVEKAERVMARKIRYLVYGAGEFSAKEKSKQFEEPSVLVWTN